MQMADNTEVIVPTDANGETSMTIDEYESRVAPLLDMAAQLIMEHPEIPEDVVQADVLSGILTIKKEMATSLHGRIPEIVNLKKKIEVQAKQIGDLKDTNQKLFMRVGREPDPAQTAVNQEPPKKSWEEIKRMIDGM